jgi:hypothetical protein
MTYENKLTRETRKRNFILLIWLIGGVAGSEVALRPQPYCAKRNGGSVAVLGSLLNSREKLATYICSKPFKDSEIKTTPESRNNTHILILRDGKWCQ